MDFYNDYDTPQSRPPARPRRAAPIDDDEADDIQRRMAAMKIRRRCNKHECTTPKTGSCDHPNHRRDNDSLLSEDDEYPGVLIILGLDTAYPACTEKEQAAWLKWLGQSGPPAALDDAA